MSNSFRPSWEETYFEIAKVISKRSKDPHTKVGAVLVKELVTMVNQENLHIHLTGLLKKNIMLS